MAGACLAPGTQTLAVAVAWLLLVGLSGVTIVSGAQYANLLAAINGTSSAAMYQWLQPVKASSNYADQQALIDKLADPTTEMTVLCFLPEAPIECLKRYPFVTGQHMDNPDTLYQYLQFYMIPGYTSLQLSRSGPTTLPTLLQQLPNTTAFNTLANLTFVPTDDPDVFYVGGLPPGGHVNVSSYSTAGKGRLYVVDSCIIPPSVFIPEPYMHGFNIADGLALADQASVSHARSLMLADPELRNYISDPDNVMMMLAPVDTAVDQYLSSLGTTLELFRGSLAARKLMQAHLFPGPAFTKAGLQALHKELLSKKLDTSVRFSSTGGDSLTIQGSINTVPITILAPDQVSGKSVIHIISDVIQPGDLGTYPTIATPAPAPSPQANPSTLQPLVQANLSIPVTADMSGAAVLLDFTNRLRTALATYFGVSESRIAVAQLTSSTATSAQQVGRRLHTSTSAASFSSSSDVVQQQRREHRARRRLLAGTTLQYSASVLSDPADKALAQQLASKASVLRANPGAMLPADMVSRFGIAPTSVKASVDTSAVQATLTPSPAPSPSPLPPTPAPSSGGGSNDTKVIVGAVVGAVAGTALLLLCAVLLYVHFWHKPRRKVSRKYVPREKTDMQVNSLAERTSSIAGRPSDAHGVLVFSGLSGVPAPAKPSLLLSGDGKPSSRRHKPGLHVQGLIFGDPFLRSTAPQYSWTDRLHDETSVGVESGINDAQLDKFGVKTGPPVIRLTRAEVVQQIRLLNTGLLGKGASALVFKGLWPSRFGPDALLAVKVLKDPYEADPAAYESFCYEAAVLASVRHPNVLRLYGYCLELPTACLIMELLPSSLKDALYSRQHGLGRQHSSLMGGHSRTRSSVNRLAQPSQPTPTVALKTSSSMALKSTSPSSDPGAAAAPQQQPSSGPAAVGGLTKRASAPHPGKGEGGSKAVELVHEGSITVSNLPAKQATELPPHTGPASGADLTLNPDRLNAATANGTAAPAQRAPHRLDATHLSQAASHASADTPASASSAATLVHNRLTISEVLQLSSDVAAGLAYLHRRPAVVALPAHPTLMLTPDPMAAHSTESDSGTVPDVVPDVENAKDKDGNMSIARIVHRDLKPSNILINSKGRAKISDFGLARWHSSSTVYTHHLGVGTLRYMAPELLLGHYTQPNAHTITNRVDIYSLGMLMWEMLSQQQPWHDLTDAQIVAAVMAGLRPPMSHNAAAIANGNSASSGSTSNTAATVDHSSPATFDTMPQLKALIGACWNQKDARRPTAAELQQELHNLLAHFGSSKDGKDGHALLAALALGN